MKSFGDINMQQNQLQEVALAVESYFPSQPIPGRLVFWQQRLYICISIDNGLPVWIPLTKELEAFNYTQNTPSNSWAINHGLNTTLPMVQVYDNNQNQLLPDNIEVVDNNNVLVTFGSAVAGRAAVLIGADTGSPRPVYSFEYSQTSPSSVWVIQHNLGYHPVVRVFIGNEEVQPSSIVHDSNFQVTVSFTQPYVGSARLI